MGGILSIVVENIDFLHLYPRFSAIQGWHRVLNKLVTYCFIWLSYRIELKESNFPENLVKVFIGQAVDIARRCVEAPLRRRPKYVTPT